MGLKPGFHEVYRVGVGGNEGCNLLLGEVLTIPFSYVNPHNANAIECSLTAHERGR